MRYLIIQGVSLDQVAAQVVSEFDLLKRFATLWRPEFRTRLRQWLASPQGHTPGAYLFIHGCIVCVLTEPEGI